MELNEQGELPREYFATIESTLNNQRYKYNLFIRYAMGHNPSILDAPAKEDPDNRVPSGFAKKMVDTLIGYMAKVGNITYTSEPPEYIEYIKTNVFDPNDEEILSTEVVADALTTGYAFELLRAQETGSGIQIREYAVSPDAGVAIYDNTLDKNMAAFAHFTSYERMVGTMVDKIYVMTIYYDTFFVVYERPGSATAWEEVDRQDHPFGQVPAVRYRIGRFDVPVFDAVIALIDEHDKVISSGYSDERDRFANSYLLMMKKIGRIVDDDGLTDADKIKQLRIFDDLGSDGTVQNVNNAVAFLTKPSRGSETAESADRFKQLIYEIGQIIDPSSDDFGTLSGIALAYKILPMEWLAAVIEAYLSKGFQRRFELIGAALVNLGIMPDIKMVTIQFRRNLPFDLATLAEIAGKLKGILSDETVLRLFPADVIPSVSVEIERLEGQAQYTLPEPVEE
jgi:SPP1 family phage portal protein